MNDDKYNRFSNYEEPEKQSEEKNFFSPSTILVLWFAFMCFLPFRLSLDSYVVAIGLFNHVPAAIKMSFDGSFVSQKYQFDQFAPDEIKNFSDSVGFIPMSYKLSYFKPCVSAVMSRQIRQEKVKTKLSAEQFEAYNKSIKGVVEPLTQISCGIYTVERFFIGITRDIFSIIPLVGFCWYARRTYKNNNQ